MEDRRARGLEIFKQIYDTDTPELMAVEVVSDAYVDNMLSQLFGEIWAREVLSVRDRRLLILGALMATGEDKMFSIHARSAKKLGELDTQQLRELVVFMVHYIGYPKAGRFWQAIEEIVAE